MTQQESELPHPDASNTLSQSESALLPGGPGTISPADPEATCTYHPDPDSGLAETLPSVPGFEIQALLGRGGMGVVYKAQHLALKRLVALKMVRAGAHAGPQERARFKSEAEAVARLQHPNIVQIFEVGEHNGLSYCALEYVEGGSLDRKLAGGPLLPREAAALVRTLAAAMHLAHSRNVVHRDLKPANVLLTADGVPKVSDFGLARQLDADSDQTGTGAVMGTPSYMAPEQACGQTHAAGPAADVYALGAILYACLTGQPPFHGTTLLETLEQVRSWEPVPPSRRQPQVPHDLDTICLKCLAKEPEKRYASARELAEDLERFLQGLPIRARPVGLRERAWRWCRRNPVVASLAAVIFLLGVLGLGGVLWQWREAEQARRRTELTLADTYTSFGVVAGGRDDPGQAVLWFAHAARLAGAGDDRQAGNRLRLAAWSRLTFQPVRALPHQAEWVRSIAFHPGGAYLLTHAEPGGNQPGKEVGEWALWDLEREARMPWPRNQQTVHSAAWSPDGQLLALGTPKGEVVLLQFPSGERQQRIEWSGPIHALAFSRDGRWLALAGDRHVGVWDCRQASFATPPLRHPSLVTSLLFDPSGTRLATVALDDLARVFPVPAKTATPLFDPVPHRQISSDVYRMPLPLFSHEGRELLTVTDTAAAHRGEITRRDPATGAPLAPRLEHGGWIAALARSPTGDSLAISATEERACILDLAHRQTESPVRLLHRDRTFMLSLAFSPDGRKLLSGGTDGLVRLWSVPAGRPIAAPLLHPNHVNLVAFSPDGQLVATAQRGGLLRLWTLPGPGLDSSRIALEQPSHSLARLSPDGEHLLVTGMTFHKCALLSARVHEVASGKAVGLPLSGEQIVLDACFLRDGPFVAVARSRTSDPSERYGAEKPGVQGGQVEIWNWQTGRRIADPVAMPSEPRSLDCSPDGRTLAVLCAAGQLLLLDPATGKVQGGPWRAQRGSLTATAWTHNGMVRFSPDGRTLLLWGREPGVRLWDLDARRVTRTLQQGNMCNDVQFSPDHRYVATGARDNLLKMWDWSTGEQVGEPLPHPDWVYSVRFSPDGRRLLTGCRDGRARLWDIRTGQLLWVVAHDHEIHAVAFTPDGRWALTAGDDRTLRIWDAATSKALAPPLPLDGEGLSLAVTPNGRHAVVSGFMPTLSVYHLDQLGGEAALELDDLCLWGEILSGQRVQEGSGTTMLTMAQWLERWQEFRRRHPEYGPGTGPPRRRETK